MSEPALFAGKAPTMIEFLSKLFDTSDFPARWQCGHWTEGHGWLHIGSDLAIAGAYAAIPLSIAWFAVSRRRDLTFPKLYWLFALFILSCGLGHFIEATIFWQPWYRLSGVVKLITATVSWATVLALIRVMPTALALPSAFNLNDELKNEIEERKRAEEEVRRLNLALEDRVGELQALFDVLPVGIGIATDPEGGHIRTNRAFAEMLRLPPTANASLSAQQNQAPTHFKVCVDGRELRPEELPIQAAALKNRVIRDMEEDVVFSDGQHLHLLGYAAPLYDSRNAVRGAVGAFVDITARKHAEDERKSVERKLQETQKLESLGILAGGIAHDFNNLLTGVVGNASLARCDLPASSPVVSHLEQIEEAAMRAADLCKQMLAYAGKGRFVVQNLDISTLVRDTAYLIQSSICKNAVLKFNLAEDVPAVLADATQMRQIVMNLVINASEAIGSRSGFIALTTGTIQADRAYLDGTVMAPDLPTGKYAFLEVSDTGSGMSPDTVSKIFDPFFTTKFTGRGLGLAAVLGIVRSHKGAMRVYSEVGKGTTFKILLPCATDSTILADDESHSFDNWRGSGTILVVDDEETVRTTTTRMLQLLGFTVLTANDGYEGVERFRENAADIAAVVLDLTMPRMSGEEVFRELRMLQPDVRVLLMSGFNEQEAVHRFLGKGLAGFLQKPFRVPNLRAKLKEMLGESGPTSPRPS